MTTKTMKRKTINKLQQKHIHENEMQTKTYNTTQKTKTKLQHTKRKIMYTKTKSQNQKINKSKKQPYENKNTNNKTQN